MDPLITKYLQIISRMDQVHAAIRDHRDSHAMREHLWFATKETVSLLGDMEIEMTEEQIAKPEWQNLRDNMMDIIELMRKCSP